MAGMSFSDKSPSSEYDLGEHLALPCKIDKVAWRSDSPSPNEKAPASTSLPTGERQMLNTPFARWILSGLMILGSATISFCLCPRPALAQPSVYPTGVTVYNPKLAYNCYVLFDAPDNKTHLVDMDGNAVHTWSHVGFPSKMIAPALAGGRRGNIFVQLSRLKGEPDGLAREEAVGYTNRTFGVVNWNDKVQWQWGLKAPGGAAHQNHDEERLANGDTLIISLLYHHVKGFILPKVLDNIIEEISPNGAVVWRWVASDHLGELGFTPAELALIHATHTPEFLHLNAMQTLGQNKWFAGGDKRFSPQNLVISSREANFVAIINKKTGHIVWEIGPHFVAVGPGRHLDRSGLTNDEMTGQHDAHMIPEGLPGAGDILLLDNQGEAGYPPVRLGAMVGSRVLEINPEEKKIVWSYSALNSGLPTWNFYTSFMGDVQRLPNGNTLVDEAMNGRFFQVTPKGEIVWEYISPYFKKTYVWGVNQNVLSNNAYRIQAVPYDWVPEGTPHAEIAVTAPGNVKFRDH